jgi:hypothetical protein
MSDHLATTPLHHHLGRRIAMYAHLSDDALRQEVRDRRRQAVHDRQLSRLLAARRWERRAASAARRARALRAAAG